MSITTKAKSSSQTLNFQQTMHELKNKKWMQITFVLKYRTLENKWFTEVSLNFYSFKDIYTYPTPPTYPQSLIIKASED